MTGSSLRRLDRLAERFRPTACYSPGPVCEQAVVVGDGSLDPPTPDLPGRCPACGRRRTYQVVELLGVDAAKL